MKLPKMILTVVILCSLMTFVQAFSMGKICFVAKADFENLPLVVPFEGEEGLVELAINGTKTFGYIIPAPNGKTYLLTVVPKVIAGSKVNIEIIGKAEKSTAGKLPIVKSNVAASKIETEKLVLTIIKRDKKLWISQLIAKDYDPEVNLVVGGGLLNPQFHKGGKWNGFWDMVKKVAEVVDVTPLGIVMKLGGSWPGADIKPIYTGKLFIFNQVPAMVAFVNIKLEAETSFSGGEFVSIEFWGDKPGTFLTTLIVPKDGEPIAKRVADKPGFISWNSTWYDLASSEEKRCEVGLGVVFVDGDKFQVIRSQDGNEAATAWQGKIKEKNAVLLIYIHAGINYECVKDLYINLSAVQREK